MFTHQCFMTVVFNSGAPCMHEAHPNGAPPPKKFGYLSIWEVLAFTWLYVCLNVHPHCRATNVKSHTFSLMWEPATWYCTSMSWSIENCQNRVSVDQYHLTVSWVQVSTHGGNSFLKLSADKLLVFQLIAGSTPSGFLYNGYKFIFLVDNMSMGASPLALATSM